MDIGSVAPVKPGDVLAGRYRVDRVLAAGGMGVVVAARHVTLDQKVAVKFLLGGFAFTSEAARRFDREAKAAALLRSEHVARVIDVGVLENGAPYLVMEFLEGEDLAQVLQARGPLPIQEAVEYVLQALEGLAEAHAAKIVHRDLKPSNLFRAYRPDGSPLIKVLDFGISKADEVQGSVTATSSMLGSPLYMSPEQMHSAKAADERADVWSIGVVLFQLLTGAVPFDGETLPALILSVSTQPPKAARQLRPDVPAGLEAVIMKCLTKNKEERFAHVGELAEALAPFAPPEALTHVERTRRMRGGVPRSGQYAISSDSNIHVAQPASFSTTKTALADSVGPQPHKRNWLIGIAGGIAAMVLISGIAIFLSIHNTKAVSAASSAPPPPPPVVTTIGAQLTPLPVSAPTPTETNTVGNAKPVIAHTATTVTKPVNPPAIPTSANTAHAPPSPTASNEFSSTRK